VSIRFPKRPIGGATELQAEIVTQQEKIKKAFADIRAAFLPHLDALRGAPGSGSGTITKGMSVCGDFVQVTIHAAKSK
jgi:hypothetical protein